MTAEKPPIRITKQRAQAFIEAADVGIDAQIDMLEDVYGVKLKRDGTFEVDDEKFALLDSADKDALERRTEQIIRAIDVLAIFRRRYG